MQQVVNFLWICGLYIALSVTMAYFVAAYDPRRPKRPESKANDDEPSEKNKAASREERVSFAILHTSNSSPLCGTLFLFIFYPPCCGLHDFFVSLQFNLFFLNIKTF